MSASKSSLSLDDIKTKRRNTMVDPVQSKNGPLYDLRDVNMSIKDMIVGGTYFTWRVKKMSNDWDQASSIIDKAIGFFNEKLNAFTAIETKLTGAFKKQSGELRDAIQKTTDSLVKLEKISNIEQLERRVILLERAAAAMNQLHELQTHGKLDKILQSLK